MTRIQWGISSKSSLPASRLSTVAYGNQAILEHSYMMACLTVKVSAGKVTPARGSETAGGG